MAHIAGAVRPALGIDDARRFLLDVIIPHGCCRIERIGDLLRGGLLQIGDAVLVELVGRVGHPRAGVAVGLQFGAHAVAVGSGAIVAVPPPEVRQVLAGKPPNFCSVAAMSSRYGLIPIKMISPTAISTI